VLFQAVFLLSGLSKKESKINTKPHYRLASLLVILSLLISTNLVAQAAPAASVQAATQFTFNPIADTYVIQSTPDTNFGPNASLRVDNSPATRSYLRFVVSGLNGSAIQSVKLRIYANSANTAGYSVYALADNNWAENAITFNNAPAPGTLINTSQPFQAAVWTEVDLGSYVQAEGTYNLVLTTTSDTNTNLASREAAGKAPQVLITTASQTTATPTDAATSTNVPTQAPTNLPTSTSIPTLVPTNLPTSTNIPTLVPTNLPTFTSVPSLTPTKPVASTPTSTAASDWQPSFPIRAAFYYPWFPQAWTQSSIYPYTNYTPSLGYYSSADLIIVKKHIEMMQYANTQVGIASWWGQGQQTDTKIAGLLTAASGTNFRWALYYENESLADPSATQIQNDLVYIRDHYGKDPSYLRVNGKFVVFVYAAPNDVCGMADRWKQANTVGAYIVLKVFPGYAGCASQPDDWHQYSPAVAADGQGKISYSISPGFWLKGQPVRLARDLNRWTQNVKDMVASGARWQLITTFSEWGEGTIVEPAAEWASASGYGQYLDVLHVNGNTSGPTQTSVPQATPTKTSIPQATATRTKTALPGTTSTPTRIVTSTPTTGGASNILLLAGDICKHNVGSTDHTGNCKKTGDLVRSVLAANPGAQVQTLGDNVNNDGGASAYDAEYTDLYAPNWGSFLNVTHVSMGNHDTYPPGGTTPYFNYFGTHAGPTKPGGYYSYDIGANWHVIALNAQCSQAGGCGVGSPQYNWLKTDLTANTKKCVLAVWHQPRWTSGRHADDSLSAAWWDLLYQYKVDIVANGHNHNYERFNLINPQEQAAADGIREFIVGTGGAPGDAYSYASHPLSPNEAIRSQSIVYGVLKLTLSDGSYSWNYLPAAGYTFSDSGTTACH
jgi:hypothetical protein